MNVLCPNDLQTVAIEYDGMGVCARCQAVIMIPVMAFRFGCPHLPRPIRGFYQWGKRRIPFEFCSAQCQEEAESVYPAHVRRV